MRRFSNKHPSKEVHLSFATYEGVNLKRFGEAPLRLSFSTPGVPKFAPRSLGA